MQISVHSEPDLIKTNFISCKQFLHLDTKNNAVFYFHIFPPSFHNFGGTVFVKKEIKNGLNNILLVACTKADGEFEVLRETEGSREICGPMKFYEFGLNVNEEFYITYTFKVYVMITQVWLVSGRTLIWPRYNYRIISYFDKKIIPKGHIFQKKNKY